MARTVRLAAAHPLVRRRVCVFARTHPPRSRANRTAVPLRAETYTEHIAPRSAQRYCGLSEAIMHSHANTWRGEARRAYARPQHEPAESSPARNDVFILRKRANVSSPPFST